MREFARQLYNEQVAFIFKVPEELQQTPCDFFGFTRAGRAILIECKQVNRPNLPVGVNPGLQPHQWRALEQAHACKAVSCILWRRGEDIVALMWSFAREISSDRKSIAWDDCIGFKDWKGELRAMLKV
jgi:hypothetical protein